MNNDSQTLHQRLAEGKIPLAEALGYAIQLGDALRQIHAQGGAHGALTPSGILLNRSSLHLLPAAPGCAEELAAYRAPEIAAGQEPDACSDIFSFGAVLYEMFTGRRALIAHPPAEGAESVANRHPEPIGNPLLDHIVGACLANDPMRRFQRIQHVLMELRLFAGAERRAQAEALMHRSEFEAMLRAETQHLQARWESQFEQIGRSAAVEHSILQEACDALNAVRAQVGELAGSVAAAQEGMTLLGKFAEETHSELAEQGQAVGKIRELEQTVRAQSVAIEMNANGMVRIDDLVERVVEALESLQSLVLEHSEVGVAVVKVA
jgi:hypothetical protein